MKVVEATSDAATVSLSAFEVSFLLAAVTQLEDLSQLRLSYLDEGRQPDVDALYGDLFRLHDAMGVADSN